MKFYTPERNFKITSIKSSFQRHYTEYFYYTGEAHNFWEMLYIEKGPLTIMENEKTYYASDNQIIFHKPMEFHQFKTEQKPDAKIMVMCFNADGNLADGLGDELFNLNHNLKSMLFSIYSDIQRGYDYINGWDICKKENGANLIEEIIPIAKLEAFLLSVLSDATPEGRQHYTKNTMQYQCIINTMHEHIYEKLSAKEIASLCCMSVSNLKKIFKNNVDCGIMGYFNKLKILKAMELLSEEKNVVEVSDLLSFSSPNYFSAVFKKETGILPSQYKRNPDDSRITLKLL